MHQLTPRETDVTRLVAQGQTNKEIGAALGLSPETIKVAMKSIFRKLRVNKRAKLAIMFMHHERGQRRAPELPELKTAINN
jgi:DNA-binding NarL/FixJ family response regulator